MSNHKRKITKEQEDELLQHYIEFGSKASAERCKALGLSPKYISSIASIRGQRRSYPDNYISIQTKNDPRWERAKLTGSVLI